MLSSWLNKSKQNKNMKIRLMKFILFLIVASFCCFFNATMLSASSGIWENVGSIEASVNEVNDINLIYNPSDGFPYVAYTYNNGSSVTVKKYNGSSWENVGSDWYNECDHSDLQLAVKPDDNKLYLAYHEHCDEGDYDSIQLEIFNGSSWDGYGTNQIEGGLDDMSFAFNSSTNEPYIAYADDVSFKLNVKKFNGSSWDSIGSFDFSTNLPSEISLAFNPSTFVPYVAYSDLTDDLTIKKLSEGDWIDVGTNDFEFGDMYKVSLAFNPSTNQPYIGYERDPGIVGLIAYNGSEWNDVASEISGSESNNDLSNLVFNTSNNKPYIAFSYLGSGKEKVNAVVSENNSWDYLGIFDMPQDGEDIEWMSLFINPASNIPYVAFSDKSHETVVRVMKYNPDGERDDDAGIFSDASVHFSSKDVKNKKTYRKEVKLKFDNVDDASFYMLSRDSDFSGKGWEDIDETVKVKVKNESKKQSFYVKFKTFEGIVSDTFEKTLCFFKKEEIKNSKNTISRGNKLVQSGKNFGKNEKVALYFSKPDGTYYDPMIIKTDSKGDFSTSYIVNKPSGIYHWYAKDINSGKTTDKLRYKIN
jgi:hypothetical protein